MKADIVLDLHCAYISLPFVFSANYLINEASLLGFSFIIDIPHKFAGSLDEAVFCPWLVLKELYNKYHPKQAVAKLPIVSFTIELGNKECIDFDLAQNQAASILNYLRGKPNKKLPIYSCKLEDFLRIYAPRGGLIMKTVPIGKKIKVGEILMDISSPALFQKTQNKTIIKDSTFQIIAKEDSILLAKVVTPIVHEGMTVMYIMTKFKKL